MNITPEYTTQLRGFEEAILEDSHDLDTWLILADFLDDHGHPSAETTRLWAKKRWAESPLTPEEANRLQLLLDEGLRPYLPRRTNTIGMEFVLVPKGTFWMSENDENAQKQVTIPYDFYIGAYQVTQGQWQTLMGDNPSCFSRTGDSKDRVEDILDSGLERFPAENVSWEDCQIFLEKLNEQNGNDSWLYRLPKEAEWEYACRGGAISKAECNYHFYFSKPANSLSSNQANFDGKYSEGDAAQGPHLRRTTQVGSHEANALGVYDMHGNVWEWCDDWYTDESVEAGSRRVIRGGSWLSSGSFCRASLRGRFTPSVRDYYLGFRVAAVPSGR